MRYYIKVEKMGNRDYYMIYRKVFLFKDIFLERWNTEQSANIRLNELNNK